ncbi:hypothetical protein [Saezia sanguinis]|uniref:hypothetical protein n=1 Tax=Saezia sanguinis TaxID=1965230 RepID=UPI00304BBB61
MIEKIFFKFMGLVIIILALWSIKEGHDNTNKYYAPLQERAAYLLALDCQPQQCVQTGEIEYLKTDVTLSKLPLSALTYISTDILLKLITENTIPI